jgi:5-formyltetrahydrofolate cyclo-ligase
MSVKKAIRTQVRQVLMGMDPTVAYAKSMSACMKLMALPEFQHAKAIMIYLPTAQEVDLGPIALRSWQEDKLVSAPKVSWDQRHMIPVVLRSLQSGLITGEHGIREPERGEPVPVEMLDMVIVPVVAFDRNGNRLGRGAGFYDRFLASPYFHGVAVGIAFREQGVPEIPVAEHDVPMHILVTDEEVLRFDRRAQKGDGETGSKK